MKTQFSDLSLPSRLLFSWKQRYGFYRSQRIFSGYSL